MNQNKVTTKIGGLFRAFHNDDTVVKNGKDNKKLIFLTLNFLLNTFCCLEDATMAQKPFKTLISNFDTVL